MSSQPRSQFPATYYSVDRTEHFRHILHRVGRIRSESNSDSDKDDDKAFGSPPSTLPPAASASVHPDEGSNTEDIPCRSFTPFTPPTTAELTNRLRQAKRTGRAIHELIHKLQNEFYPLPFHKDTLYLPRNCTTPQSRNREL
ncbi:hypothetical protein GGU11DRAFT_757580 [Lentinula aff. detonsa]|nr:hypothetical protein GGU11DRAFT_757580 [Lentinula aff. detonsa]